MKRSRKAIVLTVLAVGLVFSATATQVLTSQASTESIQPDKASVDNKVHSSKIESFNYDMELTEDYLGKLNAKELIGSCC